MNVLWTKDKYHKIFSTDNIIFNASGDGATAGRCCRLCGGDTSLKPFAETYHLEGVEGRYDHLLFECFGVKVSPPDSLICEWCVRQLRNTGRFRALVFSAFGKPPSSTDPSPEDGSFCNGSVKSNPKMQKENENSAIITYRDMIDLLNTRAGSERSKKKSFKATSSLSRRTNVQCARCKQKYPFIVQTGGGKEFVCSRCKNNGDWRAVCRKCNVAMPHKLMKDHLELHAKAEARRKSRISLLKKSSSHKNQETLKSRTIPKFKCPICPKRYMTAQHLAEHIKCMHSNGKKSPCAICGKYLKQNETLEKHIEGHAEQVTNFKCPPKSIRTKLSLKTHHYAREKRCV
ncbi:hypothetical protein evm_010845 [Chilo suppressalis]|nr:hypothetical protein evm_010845 [Chilo suppressalis]